MFEIKLRNDFKSYTVQYSTFRISNEDDKYRITITGYTAGASMS